MSAPSEAPLVGVLALQGGVDEHLGALRASGARVRAVRMPAELDALDAIVIPGGESTVLDRLMRVFGLATPLREAIAAGLPVLATCAGMVLCAHELHDAAPGQHVLGVLDIGVRRNAFGTQLDSFETRLDVGGIGEDIEAVFIRAPAVTRVGDGVRVIATVGERIVGVRQGAITALAFHPELTDDHRMHHSLVEQARDHRNRT
ncbi:Glutamine amidotransferase subunit pdxT [Propionibacterium australiense]|uniref:Pyridoxal 5'-phosphate synthase subunit PdxT n=1 Tax=Propionibacterium australiense TaxID=119981 RepID=A0A383S485_9ACTN|nr:glutaminase [Propionibacterium australiense]VEH91444.1 Glutamine amidotransferase subunit pdxT [Propionibacterium australiense]